MNISRITIHQFNNILFGNRHTQLWKCRHVRRLNLVANYCMKNFRRVDTLTRNFKSQERFHQFQIKLSKCPPNATPRTVTESQIHLTTRISVSCALTGIRSVRNNLKQSNSLKIWKITRNYLTSTTTLQMACLWTTIS